MHINFSWRRAPHRAAPPPLLLWRIMTFLVLGLMGGSILLSSYFIYVHIYQTLDSANTITVLTTGLRYEVLDIKAYELVEERLQTKTTVPLPAKNIRNIFAFAASPTTTAHDTTSTAP